MKYIHKYNKLMNFIFCEKLVDYTLKKKKYLTDIFEKSLSVTTIAFIIISL